jgi:preprotein translocase subunit YajC
MRGIFFAIAVATLISGVPAPTQQPATNQAATDQTGPGQAAAGQRGRRGFGGGDFPAGARGTAGTVTEVAADHYTIKTDAGEILTVFYSANTRIMKQPPGGGGRFAGNGGGPRRRGGDSSAASSTASSTSGDAEGSGSERQMPQPVKPSEIKVGDIITAGGDLDTAKKTIGAIFIMQIDPERAKQMHEMQANYGKTWLAGRITAIDGTRITIEGIVDHTPHAIEVDENTSFRQRRDSITMADIHPGQQLRAEGGVKGGVFLATTVVAVNPREPGQGQSPGPNPNSSPN